MCVHNIFNQYVYTCSSRHENIGVIEGLLYYIDRCYMNLYQHINVPQDFHVTKDGIIIETHVNIIKKAHITKERQIIETNHHHQRNLHHQGETYHEKFTSSLSQKLVSCSSHSLRQKLAQLDIILQNKVPYIPCHRAKLYSTEED